MTWLVVVRLRVPDGRPVEDVRGEADRVMDGLRRTRAVDVAGVGSDAEAGTVDAEALVGAASPVVAVSRLTRVVRGLTAWPVVRVSAERL